AWYSVRSIVRQPSQHQAAHRQVNHRLTALCQILVIFAHSSIAPHPRKSSFHHPAPTQHSESWHRWWFDILRIPAPLSWTLHDLQLPFTFLLNPGFEPLAAIAHVGPDQLQTVA